MTTRKAISKKPREIKLEISSSSRFLDIDPRYLVAGRMGGFA
jgi:hypothetical protein